MVERSTETSSQDGQFMRFSDEVSVAEVARLMGQLRRVPAVVSGFSGLPGNQSGPEKK